jgi:hypothetical protein
MADFIKVTRVFVNKGEKALNEQSVYVRAASIVAVRASNRLGHPGHRSTITLSTGKDMDLAGTSKEVRALLGIKA